MTPGEGRHFLALRAARRAGVFGATVLLATACGGPASTTAPPDLSMPDLAGPAPFCTDGVDGGPPATLASVERLLDQNCTSSGCHAGEDIDGVPGMNLHAGHVAQSLINKPTVETCGGTRVVPGHPESSYVYQKLSNPAPCDGLQMPRCEIGSCPLPACAVEVVRRWIAAGAPTN